MADYAESRNSRGHQEKKLKSVIFVSVSWRSLKSPIP